MTIIHSDGTVIVQNGSPIVRLNAGGAPWLPIVVVAGDDFVCGGQLYVIASVDGVVSGLYQITLSTNYAGANNAAASYTIRSVAPERQTARQIDAGLAALIAAIGSDADLRDRVLAASDNLDALHEIEGEANHLIGFSGPDTLALFDRSELLTGEPLVAVVQDIGGIAMGTYPVTRSQHTAARYGRLYAELLMGDGAVQFHIHRNGVSVHGPVTVEAGTPVNDAAFVLDLEQGDSVDVAIIAAFPDAEYLIVQIDPEPAS